MRIDPANEVVKLCVAGMQAEAENRFADALALFERAWNVRRTDLDACIAAHYLARHQASPERILHWNQTALRHAGAVAAAEGEATMAGFYPSLYLNLGKSYEEMGDSALALRYYQLAEARLNSLSGDYGDIVRRGVAAGLRRTQPET